MISIPKDVYNLLAAGQTVAVEKRASVPSNYTLVAMAVSRAYFRTPGQLLDVVFAPYGVDSNIQAKPIGRSRNTIKCRVKEVQVLKKNNRWHWKYILEFIE